MEDPPDRVPQEAIPFWEFAWVIRQELQQAWLGQQGTIRYNSTRELVALFKTARLRGVGGYAYAMRPSQEVDRLSTPKASSSGRGGGE
jgi:hypothetical protein